MGSRIYYFSGGKETASNIGLAIVVTSSSSAAFQVSLSYRCRLHPSHLRCFPEGEGASPVSVELWRWRSDNQTSANPTTNEVGAHIPAT